MANGIIAGKEVKNNAKRPKAKPSWAHNALKRALEKKMPKPEPIAKSLCGGYRISSDTSKEGEWNEMDYHYGP